MITRPGRQKPSYISALNHNECVALVGEAESVGGELIQPHCVVVCGPGSVGGIATGYGLDGPGIESR